MRQHLIVGLLFTWLCSLTPLCAEQKADMFDLSADDVRASGDIITAEGNAFLLYGDAYMVAQKIIYNKQSKEVHLEGGAKVYQGNILYLDVERVDITLEDKHTIMSNLYLQSTMGIWIMAKQGEGQDDNYTFKKGVISGCDIQHPLWHLNVSSGTYNAQKEYISVWNPRFYLGSMPVFYFPYFFAPTGNIRKTGLLSPEMSFSNKQGFMYMQPLFIAPFNRWDMTLSPQARTQRGYGGEVEFRFADKENNIATFRGRYFQNNDEYMRSNNLKNQHIYGGTFQYETQDIFVSNNEYANDGFYTDITYMNDLEYMRLKSLNAAFNTRLYESRINYFVNTNKHYFGTYFKYYLDLSKESNVNTFQSLPQIHYHHYTDSLFFKNLLYTFDFQGKYVTRASGYKYFQNTFSLPFGVAFPFFKDYFSIGANVDMYATSVLLQDTQGITDAMNHPLNKSINYSVSSYNISLNSDIARPYKHFFHSMHFEALFSGALYKYTSNAIDDDRYEAYNKLLEENNHNPEALKVYWNPSDIVDIVKNKHKIDLKLSQYFYGKNGKELFYWRMYQRLFIKDSFLTRNQVLRNELGFSPIEGLNLSASAFYSYSRNTFSEASINASFNRWGLDSNLTFYFKLDPLYLSSGLYSQQGSNNGNTGFLRGTMGYDFGYFYLNTNIGYDVGLGYLKDWYVTISKDIRCFGIGLKIAQDVRPTLTADNQITPITNQYVKLEFRFVPLANIGATYRFKE